MALFQAQVSIPFIVFLLKIIFQRVFFIVDTSLFCFNSLLKHITAPITDLYPLYCNRGIWIVANRLLADQKQM